MASPTDALLAKLEAELEERKSFQEALVEAAQQQGRDLRPDEMELYERASARMTEVEKQMGPLREGARIAVESGKRTAELRQMYETVRNPQTVSTKVEYRSAGAYVADLYLARMGDDDALGRIDLFHRVAAHQTTADNPGLIPIQIVTPVVNFVDASRPLVAAIGPMDLGVGAWQYARVTQHTQVGPQSAEKAELPSRKLQVTLSPITAPTLGGYVNVSRQNISRTSPAILDMVINDLAAQYATESEAAAGDALATAATAGPTIPASPTALDIASAVWEAVGTVAGATQGQGRIVIAASYDMLGVVGPLFPGVNPQNAFSSGFDAVNFGPGPQGTISGITLVASAGLPSGTLLVFSTAAVKAFELRYGAMQVVEPSVWGVQVGYAGDFECMVIEPAAVVEITQAP